MNAQKYYYSCEHTATPLRCSVAVRFTMFKLISLWPWFLVVSCCIFMCVTFKVSTRWCMSYKRSVLSMCNRMMAATACCGSWSCTHGNDNVNHGKWEALWILWVAQFIVDLCCQWRQVDKSRQVENNWFNFREATKPINVVQFTQTVLIQHIW